MAEQEETRSRFLFRNLVKGLVYLGVLLVVFIYTAEFIQENFNEHVIEIKSRPVLMFSLFFVSEVVFGIIPPVLFMSAWKLLMNVELYEYIVYLGILFVLSFSAGVIGFKFGRYFSKTTFYRRIEQRYLMQYNKQLKRYGVFLVLVGAVTPIPFAGTCMLAGSVHIPFPVFMRVCAFRIFYFILYGWVVWSFPNLFT